jgi:hypothetical protein
MAGRYQWEVTVGHLIGEGSRVRWDLAGVRPGRYAAVVRSVDAAGAPTECVVRVVVSSDPGGRGGAVGTPQPPHPAPPPMPARETGRDLLIAGAVEAPGYGLYSYLLFGSPPTAAGRTRHLKTLEALWGGVPDIAALEEYVSRAQLNIAYVPVRASPPGAVTPEQLLADYDYARARSILRHLPRAARDGPYIVSSLRPMANVDGPPPAGPYLVQDMSRVPPHLCGAWVKEFLNQAARERFWEERTTAQLALTLRGSVGVLAEGFPEVKNALDVLIAWVK